MAKSKIYIALVCGMLSITSFANTTIQEKSALKKLNNQLYQSSKDLLPITLDGKKGQNIFEKTIKKRSITLTSEEGYQLANLIHEQENRIYRLQALLNYSINQTHYDPRQDPKYKKTS